MIVYTVHYSHLQKQCQHNIKRNSVNNITVNIHVHPIEQCGKFPVIVYISQCKMSVCLKIVKQDYRIIVTHPNTNSKLLCNIDTINVRNNTKLYIEKYEKQLTYLLVLVLGVVGGASFFT